MKRIAAISLAAIFSTGQTYAMTMVETPGTGNRAAASTPSQVRQSGKLDAIYASASKLVIGGVTYAYNPLTTVVMVNGKRSTISDVRVGETVQFQTSSQGAHQPALLTSMSVQRR
ncbi:MAG: hypothetical protein ACYCY4_08735 [Thiobacillus sp.]